MPTYEYRCTKCDENFEVVRSFTDKPLKKHPGSCGGEVKKVFHARGVVFKGSGFYATDSRPKSSVKAAGDSTPSSSDSTSSDSSTSASTGSGSSDSGSSKKSASKPTSTSPRDTAAN